MTRLRFFGAACLGILVAALAACVPAAPFGADHTDLDRTPRPVGAPAPDYAGPGIALPPSFAGARIFDPGWNVPPGESHGVYLAPVVEEDRVTFTAVSEEGIVLWTAERPLLCSAFVVADSEDGPLAVLMDITAGESTVSETTVSAYDLRTGAERWGPVAVPGPHLGPGLIFAAPPLESIGETGPRMAIDSATGTTLADESAEAGVTILSEHDGTVLLADNAHLVARTAEEPVLWRLPLADLSRSPDALRAGAGPHSDPGLALLGDRAAGATLLNLLDGTVVAHEVRAVALDRSTGIRLLLLAEELRAVDATGHLLWSDAVPADATLLSAGDGAVYLRSAEGTAVFDTTSGEVTLSIPRDAEVPQQISASGAGIIGPYGRSLLVTPVR